jgi:hypothetical protein
MSLDVYLRTRKPVDKYSTNIFVREDGKNRELSIEEAKERFPNANPMLYKISDTCVYTDNITSNLIGMAKKANLYDVLWNPRESGYVKAKDLVDSLQEGLKLLKSNPEIYKELNPENGWGTYEQLVNFTQDYLDACLKYPDANVETSK